MLCAASAALSTSRVLAAAELGLLVPGDGLGEGPEGFVFWVGERPSGKGRQVAGNIIRGSQLGGDLNIVSIIAKILGH